MNERNPVSADVSSHGRKDSGEIGVSMGNTGQYPDDFNYRGSSSAPTIVALKRPHLSAVGSGQEDAPNFVSLFFARSNAEHFCLSQLLRPFLVLPIRNRSPPDAHTEQLFFGNANACVMELTGIPNVPCGTGGARRNPSEASRCCGHGTAQAYRPERFSDGVQQHRLVGQIQIITGVGSRTMVDSHNVFKNVTQPTRRSEKPARGSASLGLVASFDTKRRQRRPAC